MWDVRCGPLKCERCEKHARPGQSRRSQTRNWTVTAILHAFRRRQSRSNQGTFRFFQGTDRPGLMEFKIRILDSSHYNKHCPVRKSAQDKTCCTEENKVNSVLVDALTTNMGQDDGNTQALGLKRKPRGTLDKMKCDRCRNDKQKVRILRPYKIIESDKTCLECEPQARLWPQKCERCSERGYDCSPSSRKERKPSRVPIPASEATTSAPGQELAAIPPESLRADSTWDWTVTDLYCFHRRQFSFLVC